jgi:hypothetical protein
MLKMKTGSIDTGKRSKRKGFPASDAVNESKSNVNVVVTTPNGTESGGQCDDPPPATPTATTIPIDSAVHLSTTPLPSSGDIVRMAESPRVESVPEHPEDEVANADGSPDSSMSVGPFTNQQGVKFTADSATKGTSRPSLFYRLLTRK